MDRAPFRNTEDALRFLFNPERVVCSRSAVSRLADMKRSEPGQLSGLDGAATAASAQAMLEGRLTQIQLMVLACRYAPEKSRCYCKSDCCSGWTVNPQWQNAISYIAQEARLKVFKGASGVHLRFIAAVLWKEYAKHKGALTDVGTSLGMSLGTCTNHRQRILDWLMHSSTGVERIAYLEAESGLRLGGFIN